MTLYLTIPVFPSAQPSNHLKQVFVGARLEGSPILAVMVYGGTAVAAGALLSAVAERPAPIVRDRILERHGRTTRTVLATE